MKTVLVIEDDEPLRALLSKILSRSYRIIASPNGFEAWCWLTEGNQPDLIVSDITMPHIDGIELLENLNKSALFKHIPVIVLSGVKDEDKKERCLKYGARAFLPKPFEPRLLLDTIKRVLTTKPNVHA